MPTSVARPATLSFPRLNPKAPTPLYHQMFLVIREMILSGELAPETVLPGEQDLADLLAVSRITVKRALNDLASVGFVSRRRGIGTVVQAKLQIPVIKGSFDNVGDSIRKMGMESRTILLEIGDISANKELAGRLDLRVGAPIQRSVWRRLIQHEPFSHVESYVPKEVARNFSRRDLNRLQIQELLERSGYRSLTADQWISAVAAQPNIATHLDISVGYPLLRIERMLRAEGGQPLQLIYCHLRSDRFQWHIQSEGSHFGDVIPPGAETLTTTSNASPGASRTSTTGQASSRRGARGKGAASKPRSVAAR